MLKKVERRITHNRSLTWRLIRDLMAKTMFLTHPRWRSLYFISLICIAYLNQNN